MRIRNLMTALVGAVVLSWSGVCLAAGLPDDPAPALVSTIDGVLDLTVGQTPATIEQRIPEIRAKMSETFATEVVVQRAFGRNWSKLTPEQQKEAIDLLGRIVIRTYAAELGRGDRPKIAIVSSRELGPDRREVVSTATRDGTTANVIYRFGKIDGKWKVYDVLAEGISVVGNYRQQFDAHFEKQNAADLLKQLREKLNAPVPAPTAAKS